MPHEQRRRLVTVHHRPGKPEAFRTSAGKAVNPLNKCFDLMGQLAHNSLPLPFRGRGPSQSGLGKMRARGPRFCLRLCPTSRPSGYRTVSGSERAKNSTSVMTGDGAMPQFQNTGANPAFSLSLDPARYRSRFCTEPLCWLQSDRLKTTSWAKPSVTQVVNLRG
jgi:hypothetical protein